MQAERQSESSHPTRLRRPAVKLLSIKQRTGLPPNSFVHQLPQEHQPCRRGRYAPGRSPFRTTAAGMFAHVKPPQLSSLASSLLSTVPHKVYYFFLPPSCRSRELMDAFENVTLPIFPTKITENKYLLPEKPRPVCSPGLF